MEETMSRINPLNRRDVPEVEPFLAATEKRMGFVPNLRTRLGQGRNREHLSERPQGATRAYREKQRRDNYLAVRSLPWAQEASGSNPDAPTNFP
jgi:hypothetical protein